MYYIFLLQVLIFLITLFLAWQAFGYFRRMRLYKKTKVMPMPKNYQSILNEIPQYKVLPDNLKDKIRQKILFFINSKEFIGVKTEVTDEMRVVISFFACLEVVNIEGECYDELISILIYPYEVMTKEIRGNGGIYASEKLILEGQSIGDTVVIAWRDARHEAYHLRQHNVVIHEFAHVLDFEEGEINGIPPIERSKYNGWTQVLYKRFKELRRSEEHHKNWDEYKLIGDYAATNEAEFFAVVTELFFQKPKTLKSHFPDLYKQFCDFYHLDTAQLFKTID